MGEAFPPAGATDCHAHVIGPKARFPLASRRAYTPQDAPFEALAEMLARLGLERVVLVQTSVFGTDNACTLDAAERLGDRARAVAVIDDATTAPELDDLHGRGVRGLRLNLATLGLEDPAVARAKIAAAAQLCTRNGWHLQIHTGATTVALLGEDLLRLPVPVVLDHFALIAPAAPDPDALAVVLALLETGRGYVKLSGRYRLDPAGSADQQRSLALRLFAANPERVLWGSDWPHTAGAGERRDAAAEVPFQDIDTAGELRTLKDWLSADDAARVLVDNPARLYGF